MKRLPILMLYTVPMLMEAPAALAADARTNAEPTAIEEIFVTATKRSKSVRELPLSIDAFSGAELEQRGLTRLEDIVRYSPGVTLIQGNTPDSNQINIRGAGSDTGDFNRPFGVFYEDVPLMNPTLIGSQPDIDPFDMATVEVLKGPQGTLFGGSALVGAVRYTPNKPSFERTEGSLSYGYGTTSGSDDVHAQYTAMLNAPVADTLAFRFAGSVRDRPGVIDDTYSGLEDIDSVKTQQYRGAMAWRPHEDFNVQLSYQKRKVDADANVGTLIDNDRGRQVSGALRGEPDGSESDLDIAGVNLSWSGNEHVTVSLISNLLRKDATYWSNESAAILPNGFDVLATLTKKMETDQVTHELRLVSNQQTDSGIALLSGWEYAAGLFYMKSEQKLDLLSQVSILDPPIPLLTATVQASADAEETAFYFDATRSLFENVEINLGGRFFRQETPIALAVSGSAPVADTLKEEGFNPKASLTWHIASNIASFVSASKGFRFGGINIDPFLTGEPPRFFKSDSLWNYELGARTTWLDGRLQLDATVFFVDWQDKQTSQLTSTLVPSEYIANTGGREMKGAELLLRTALPAGFAWMINGSYVDSKTTESYTSPRGFVAEGTRDPDTPRFTGSTVLDFAHQAGDWSSNASLGYAYRSATDSRNFVPLAAFGSIDASFRVQNLSWKMSPEFSINVLNLANDDALVSGASNAPQGVVGRQIKAKTLTPRTVMLNAKVSF